MKRITYVLIGVFWAAAWVVSGCSGSGSDAGRDDDAGVDASPLPDAGNVADIDADHLCGEVNVAFRQITSTVVLLMDQSASMNAPFSGYGSRWDTVAGVLLNSTDGIVKNLESEMRLGLTLYTSVDGFEKDMDCPLLTEEAPDLNNYQNIAALYDSSTWQHDTPTGESIDVVVSRLRKDGSESKSIILITDGLPDTCAHPNPQENSPEELQARAEAVYAAANAFRNGIVLYIIYVNSSFGSKVEDHVQYMANAGAGVRSGANYYLVSNQGALEDALGQIINGVRSCNFALLGDVNVKQGNENDCIVTAGQTDLVYQDPNGWQFNEDRTEIELAGTACEQIKTGTVSVSGWCPCSAILIL
jgi:hypothetical protein